MISNELISGQSRSNGRRQPLSPDMTSGPRESTYSDTPDSTCRAPPADGRSRAAGRRRACSSLGRAARVRRISVEREFSLAAALREQRSTNESGRGSCINCLPFDGSGSAPACRRSMFARRGRFRRDNRLARTTPARRVTSRQAIVTSGPGRANQPRRSITAARHAPQDHLRPINRPCFLQRARASQITHAGGRSRDAAPRLVIVAKADGRASVVLSPSGRAKLGQMLARNSRVEIGPAGRRVAAASRSGGSGANTYVT